MELVRRIVFVTTVAKGESVSHGRTCTADRKTVVGTLRIGILG
jgi:alanine racemase